MPQTKLQSNQQKAKPTRSIIIGVDPGTIKTGWGVIEVGQRSRLHFLDCSTIYLNAKKPIHERLLQLHRELSIVFHEFNPSHFGIETVFHAHNVQSALKLGHARGVALLIASQAGCKIEELSPTAVKQSAVGYGRASKAQVQQMVTSLLGLPEPPQEDAADALAVAMATWHRL